MKKSDLKTGMLVEMSSGDIGILVNGAIHIGAYKWWDYAQINDKLGLNETIYGGEELEQIVKISDTAPAATIATQSDEIYRQYLKDNTIWERPEEPTQSDIDKRIKKRIKKTLKALDYINTFVSDVKSIDHNIESVTIDGEGRIKNPTPLIINYIKKIETLK